MLVLGETFGQTLSCVLTLFIKVGFVIIHSSYVGKSSYM